MYSTVAVDLRRSIQNVGQNSDLLCINLLEARIRCNNMEMMLAWFNNNKFNVR